MCVVGSGTTISLKNATGQTPPELWTYKLITMSGFTATREPVDCPTLINDTPGSWRRKQAAQ